MGRAATAPPETPEARPWERPAGVALWGTALVTAAVSLAGYLRRPLSDRLADLHVYRLAVSSFVHGASLYAPHLARGNGFTYPPFAALAFLPLAFVPEPAGRILWSALTLAAVAALAWVLAGPRGAMARRLGPPSLAWPAVAVLLLASKPVQSDLRFGQVSLLLTLGVAIDVLALDGRKAQGILTGVAAAVKLTPLVFAPYLWITGRRKAAGLAVAGFAGATALGALVFPHDSAMFWSRNLWSDTRGLPLAETGNQSVYGVLLRAGLHGATLTVLWVALAALLSTAGLCRARRAWLAGQPLLGLAIAGCVSILVSPISWTHHQIWILLAAGAVFTGGTAADDAIAAALIVPMVIGLPGFAGLGPVGRWIAANHRAALALAVTCLIPFVAPGASKFLPGRRVAEIRRSDGRRR